MISDFDLVLDLFDTDFISRHILLVGSSVAVVGSDAVVVRTAGTLENMNYCVKKVTLVQRHRGSSHIM